MGYRMPFPIPFFPIILVAALVSLAFPWFLNSKKNVNRAQTHFLLNQINEVAAMPTLIRTKPEMIRLLKKSNIDRNSCKLTASEVLDSWGTPILFDFAGIPDRFEIRSAGPDQRKNTNDDIHGVIQSTKPTP